MSVVSVVVSSARNAFFSAAVRASTEAATCFAADIVLMVVITFSFCVGRVGRVLTPAFGRVGLLLPNHVLAEYLKVGHCWCYSRSARTFLKPSGFGGGVGVSFSCRAESRSNNDAAVSSI